MLKQRTPKRERDTSSTIPDPTPTAKRTDLKAKPESKKIDLSKLPLEARRVIGKFMHQVPEASTTGKVLLGLNGTNRDYILNRRSYGLLSDAAKRGYDVGAMACAVARRLLTHGRGNVTQDILKSSGRSSAGVSQKRWGFVSAPSLSGIDSGTRPLDYLTDTELKAMRAISAGAGNCGEFADTAYAFMAVKRLAPGTQVFRCSNFKDDHAFLILVTPNASGRATKLICDPWINFIGTENQAKQSVNGLVNFGIYQPALLLADQCFTQHRSALQTPEKTSRGAPNCHIHQPQIRTNIFTIPVIRETVGTVDASYAESSTAMENRANGAAAQARKDVQKRREDPSAETQYYVLEDHDFETGEEASLPMIPRGPR